MTTQLKSVSGKNFAEKILNGERDFSRIKLEERLAKLKKFIVEE